MVTRKFEKEWEESTSLINHRTEKNVFSDFFDYLKDLKTDFNALKKDYEERFDKLSDVKLADYIDLFKQKCFEYFEVLLKDPKDIDSFYSLDYSKCKEDLFEKDGNKFTISDKYYEKLNQIANDIFTIEESVGRIVEELWQEELSSIDEYNANGKYFLLAHVDRKTASDSEISKELADYNKQLQGLCFSAISDQKTRIYNNSQNAFDYYYNPSGAVGIIAIPKAGGIVGISNDDMLSTEYINGECAFGRYFEHSKVCRCFENGNSEICCNGTKICPPKEIFNTSIDTINEIILDKNNIDVVAVFYLKDSRGNAPERFEQYKKEQEKICGHKLPSIEITSRNKLHQYNLDEIMMNS